MRKEFSFESQDGKQIFVYKWEAKKPVAAVQIAHGAVEHALRYDDFANALAKQGFVVYANDHRGHGKTAGEADNVGYFSDQKGGINLAIDDMLALTKIIKKENPYMPVFLFGHSMGSHMSRLYAAKYGGEIDGLLLTGTGRVNNVLISIVRAFAKVQMVLLGRKHKSPLLNTLVFGTLNQPFKGDKGCEFISTDQAVIDAYEKDEYCGNTITPEFVYELFWCIKQATKKETFAATPNDIPIFIGAGEFDTMGGNKLSAVNKDVADFSKNNEVTFKRYENMRHEILNEKDKQVVYTDIIEWLKAQI
ncbi:MAG: alpha/beta hydrolase [Clostridia bacterium]|jgi:alpha-beta hydrolase superfamily lysophospholipase|nr:alpha/beta hydrolase [Clostridia bacterium]MBT7121579.1 alpha/beta hydrolase [Clostridia bacterium]